MVVIPMAKIQCWRKCELITLEKKGCCGSLKNTKQNRAQHDGVLEADCGN